MQIVRSADPNILNCIFTRTVRGTSHFTLTFTTDSCAVSRTVRSRKYVRVAKRLRDRIASRPAGLESKIWRNMIIAGRNETVLTASAKCTLS